MGKPHPIPAALTLASRLTRWLAFIPVGLSLLMLSVLMLSVLMLFGGAARAQPIFTKAGSGSFSTINTPLLLNDAAGKFQTQGNVLCQASQSGQLSSPSGVCMQYTPSIPFIGGAAAIFGLKGGLADYVSPALVTATDTPAGSNAISVLSNPAIVNVSATSSIGAVQTLSVLSTSVAGALPASETIASTSIGPQVSVLLLSRPTLADLPPGSAVSFSTNTSAQQFTGIASSVDLTAHQAPGSSGQAWGGNFIVEAEPGSNGAIHGIEIDAANFSSNIGGYGIWLGNNGNQNMNAGFLVGAGVGGKGWLYGLQSVSAVNDDVLSVSSANTFTDDRGSHGIGGIYQGSYSTAILQAINPKGLTPSTQALFTITPKGGIIDSSPTPVGAASGSTQAGASGSTGIILVCGGTLSSLTVTMPSLPLAKQPFHIASECTVSALTVSGAGVTVLGAPASITPSTPITFVYDNDRSVWIRW